MTEAEWLACNNPRLLAEFVRGRWTERKARLLLAACYRLHRGADARQAAEAEELFADGQAGEEELIATRNALAASRDGRDANDLLLAARMLDKEHGRGEAGFSSVLFYTHYATAKLAAVAVALRELFPFRAATADPSWLAWNNNTAPALASAIYEGRSFDLLPVLADALEESGCTDAELLAHLRSPGPHVRGCWALDLVLGKA